MKILKLLNKKNFSIIFNFIFSLFVNAEEQPVDIWNIEKEKVNLENSNQTIIMILIKILKSKSNLKTIYIICNLKKK